ncbi:MAG: permease, partial [Coriobacteriia bacterium]|nr:permease [Coriobacteriia bacterium]
MELFEPLERLAEWVTYDAIGLERGGRLGSALAFFLYDVPKILLLLAIVVFLIAIVRSYFPPEKTRRYLSHSKEYVGNALASLLGVVTPFCSCSAVPLFIGFVESGVPLGVTFSFLIASPMVNEVALVLLFGMFGWKIAALYAASGLAVAMVAGIVMGKLGLEDHIEDYVRHIRTGEAAVPEMTWQDRLAFARASTRDIVKKVWPYVVAGIGVGAFMHGYVPADALAGVAGPRNPLAVPAAVLVGIPLYSSAAGIVPLVGVLTDKGMAMGTVLAFMMAVTALSLPEFVILRKVMKPRLLAAYAAVGFVTITLTGYLFNWAIPALSLIHI